MQELRSIGVHCGSSPGRLHGYVADARALAASMVAQSIRFVYGGANVGIMGVLADTFLKLGGEVAGVIPEELLLCRSEQRATLR